MKRAKHIKGHGFKRSLILFAVAAMLAPVRTFAQNPGTQNISSPNTSSAGTASRNTSSLTAASGNTPMSKAMPQEKRPAQQKKADSGQSGYKTLGGRLMQYVVENGDTVYLAPLNAARIYEKKPRQKGREWRKYYKLVYNFAAVYPYVLVAKDIVNEADSVIKTDNLKYVSKDRYVGGIVKELFNSFEEPMKNMTVTQGQLMMLLIDRECGISSYDIIKTFKNQYAAGFWQGIAKLFGNSLKRRYDPEEEDRAIEDLVQQWEKGTFEQTYFEIFWKYPPMIELPPQYRKPDPTRSTNPASQAPSNRKVSDARLHDNGRK